MIEVALAVDELSCVLPHITTEPVEKPDPASVTVIAALPATVEEGVRLVSTGTGFGAGLIVKLIGMDAPPPGAGLETETDTVAALVRSAAGMVAVRELALKKDELSGDPFQSTLVAGIRFVPVTVSVVGPDPATAEVGLRLVSVGSGLGVGVDVPCPEFAQPRVSRTRKTERTREPADFQDDIVKS